jgi:hypothetical protein
VNARFEELFRRERVHILINNAEISHIGTVENDRGRLRPRCSRKDQRFLQQHTLRRWVHGELRRWCDCEPGVDRRIGGSCRPFRLFDEQRSNHRHDQPIGRRQSRQKLLLWHCSRAPPKPRSLQAWISRLTAAFSTCEANAWTWN